MSKRIRPHAGVVVGNLTHPGRVRRNNEDSYGYFEHPQEDEFRRRGRLAVVADGMGGQAAGEVASTIVVRVLRDSYYGDAFLTGRPEDLLIEAIATANRLIFDEAQRDGAKSGMGTTVTILLLRNGHAWIAHVGDSRAYMVRRGILRQITEDHSRVWELMREGLVDRAGMKNHPFGGSIYRAVGDEDAVEVDVIGPMPVHRGDTLLLCSDGLTDMVDDSRIVVALNELSPAEACQRLLELAKQAGGRDNITAQILFVATEPEIDPQAPPFASVSPVGGAVEASGRWHGVLRRLVPRSGPAVP